MNVTRIVVLFVLLASACLRAESAEDFLRKVEKDGRRYKEALVKAIKTTDRIVVTEHSHADDFPPSEQSRKDLPEFEYARVELDGPAKAKFLKNAEAMNDTTQTLVAPCGFVPHHAIKFYSGAKLTSTMEICFHCGGIYWDGADKMVKPPLPPEGLWTPVLPAIKDAGFRTDQGREVWVARLEERRKAVRGK